MKDFSVYTEKITDLVIGYTPKLFLAIATLLIGLLLIKKIIGVLNKHLNKKTDDPTLVKFLSSLLKVLLYVILLISIAGIVGVQTTSFIAVLGAAGLAIGLALQGSLANFAGGVLILLFKPYKVNDIIEAQGYIGRVDDIQIFNTILKTPDNRTIILPNGKLANNAITNINHESKRRVDLEYGIGYTDDVAKAKQIINDLLLADERVLSDPSAPFVALKELGDSAVIIVVRAWCQTSDYWGIYFDMQEKVKASFDKEGISIPFPQRDIHIYNEK